MGKKCIPGVICVENMTLFVCVFLGMVVLYLFLRVQDLAKIQVQTQQTVHSHIRPDPSRCDSNRGDPLTNPYVPPIKCDSGGLPINVPTQHYTPQYSQVGIVTKQKGTHSEILPLMGRRTITSRNKWQYYTVSGGGNGGNLQTKLPVKAKGKNCSGEYGCDEIFSRDEVYVEGYQDLFVATMYENGLFSYIPF